MDLRILLSVLSVMYVGIVYTVSSAPMGEKTASTPKATPGPVHHIRNKRCSCATFMDRECVYFCHLDIIWVNTPERVVSYGLGNASRKKRAIRDSKQDPRCKCVREDDGTCFARERVFPRYMFKNHGITGNPTLFMYTFTPRSSALPRAMTVLRGASANTSWLPRRAGLKGKRNQRSD
uniref:Endothelin-1 n=1 Tax=Esox lucius TaxID=8010 RepID=A0A3P8XNZ7_ESOLU